MTPKIAAPQEENRSIAEFSQRTERLAQRLGVSLRGLPPTLKISERMLFAYRSGANPITAKAWAKLRSAEVTAGLEIAAPQRSGEIMAGESAAPYGSPRDLSALARNHFDELMLAAKNDPARVGWILEQMKEHLAIPKNWRTREEINRRARELADQLNAEAERRDRERHQPGHSSSNIPKTA